MKQEEIIELLKGIQSPLEDYAELVGAPAFTYGHKYVYPYPEDYAIEEAITALKEVQQYREIGTVEECREAVEKQKAKYIKIEPYCPAYCPTCRFELSESLGDGYYKYFENLSRCPKCGQAIQWSENLEGMEDMSEIKLKPCPFCGGKAVYMTKSNASDHYCVGFDFEVECEDCGMSLPERYKIRFSFSENGELNILNDERPIAAEKWNRRTGE